MPYKEFDRSRLKLLPMKQRIHDIDIDIMLDVNEKPEYINPKITKLAAMVLKAKDKKATVLLMMGGHVVRSGVAPQLIQLMEQGYITHFAFNGATAIHDFELAMQGKTCESVAKYIREGQFGLWQEDCLYNDAVNLGIKDGLGFGEALGKYIEENNFPFKETSILAAGYRNKVPVTVHVGVGCDIVHELPNADGAAIGEATYKDFLIYASAVENLENGVFLNFGSAVIGPEVYLKALSMARNVAHQEGRSIKKFTTAVFDLLPLENENVHETPQKNDPRYYFRPWKTIMTRTIADGGESFYVQGEHRSTVAALSYEILKKHK